MLGEVVGEVISESQKKRLQVLPQTNSQRLNYFVKFVKNHRQEQMYIDAFDIKRSPFIRFINHSCKPNCYLELWWVGKMPRMALYSVRAINTGEFLSIDYGEEKQFICTCEECISPDAFHNSSFVSSNLSATTLSSTATPITLSSTTLSSTFMSDPNDTFASV